MGRGHTPRAPRSVRRLSRVEASDSRPLGWATAPSHTRRRAGSSDERQLHTHPVPELRFVLGSISSAPFAESLTRVPCVADHADIDAPRHARPGPATGAHGGSSRAALSSRTPRRWCGLLPARVTVLATHGWGRIGRVDVGEPKRRGSTADVPSWSATPNDPRSPRPRSQPPVSVASHPISRPRSASSVVGTDTSGRPLRSGTRRCRLPSVDDLHGTRVVAGVGLEQQQSRWELRMAPSGVRPPAAISRPS